MAYDPITVFIEPTDAIVRATAARLDAALGGACAVETYSGTSLTALFEFLPDILVKHQGKPVAVVVYSGSDVGNLPRRTVRVSVLLLVENADFEAGQVSCRYLLDRVYGALDEHTVNEATWKASGDSALDLGPGVEAIKADFTVLDH